MSWMARCFIPQQLALRHRLGTCYDWHKLVWTFFPGNPEAKRDFLFRLDTKSDGTLLHILGKDSPVCPEQFPLETLECREIPETFLQHDTYRFDVVCNPGRKIRAYTEDGMRKKNSRREAIINKDEQETWFTRKAEVGGFRITRDTLRTESWRAHHFNKKNKYAANEKKISTEGTHISVRFCGILQVTNRELFSKTFSSGIGNARSFGFGLLLLAPVHSL